MTGAPPERAAAALDTGEGGSVDPQAGSGLFGTWFGVLFFLGFLLFATQLAVSLYARSVLTSAALDAGRIVATAGGSDGRLDPGELAAGRRAAEDRVQDLLGDDATFALSALDPAAGTATVTVATTRPRLLLGGGTLGSAVIERSVTVRLELLR